MCGICGVVYADRRRAVAREQIQSMCDVLEHRGPDSEGVYLDGRVALGHRRLSIVDLAHGQQPMGSEDGTVTVVFNGEIYNFADYLPALRARGHHFRSRCDTEVLVHLHEEDATAHLANLRGMFALAVWDARHETLTLARDHSGVKPLYFARTAAGDLIFASEIKAIFASGLIEPELESSSVAEYFAFGHVAGARTLYRGVYKLQAGHVLVWRDGECHERAYWSVGGVTPPRADAKGLSTADAAGAAFWPRFVDSVRSQLMADVPLGVFLSGGLDSTLIVAAMREAGVERVQSFSVGFEDKSTSELPFASVAARAFATEHHAVVVTPREFFEQLPSLSWHRDHPLTFSASIPLYFVSRLAREHVKVVLTGEGSDELFAGYGRYPRGLWNRAIAQVIDDTMPRLVRRFVSRRLAGLRDGYLSSRLKRSFLARSAALEESYLEAFAEFDGRQRAALLGPIDGTEGFGDLASLLDPVLLRHNPLEAMLRLDQATYLEELLMKQDHMSMATSIESRVPFLDHRLVEWAAGVPPSAKLRGFTGKALVRAAAARHLPVSITRGPKRGFPVPLAAWFRGPGLPILHDSVPDRGDSLLDAAYVRRLLAEHQGGANHAPRLWRILAFQVWRRDVLGAARAEFHRARRDRTCVTA